MRSVEPEESLGSRLKAARVDARLQQAQFAEDLGVHSVTVSKWERDVQRPAATYLDRMAELYDVETRDLLRGESLTEVVSRDTFEETWTPNPALRSLLPDRAYSVAIGYCRRLEAARVPADEIDVLERLLIDNRFGVRDRRIKELSAEELIMNIDATWRVIQETLGLKGIHV
ncbi:hypothetical protein BH11GEM2_BH11GEM2_37700 [soil metagenome]